MKLISFTVLEWNTMVYLLFKVLGEELENFTSNLGRTFLLGTQPPHIKQAIINHLCFDKTRLCSIKLSSNRANTVYATHPEYFVRTCTITIMSWNWNDSSWDQVGCTSLLGCILAVAWRYMMNRTVCSTAQEYLACTRPDYIGEVKKCRTFYGNRCGTCTVQGFKLRFTGLYNAGFPSYTDSHQSRIRLLKPASRVERIAISE